MHILKALFSRGCYNDNLAAKQFISRIIHVKIPMNDKFFLS